MHNSRRAAAVALLTLATASAAFAQTPAPSTGRAAAASAPVVVPKFDSTGVGDTSIFAPLSLRPGNIYRTGSGAPAKDYWQQKADYDLKATLDTASKTLHGGLTLRYTNRSPDTLTFIWFQVEQNAFKTNSMNSFIFPEESRFGARGFEGGDVIERLNQIRGAGAAAKPTALKSRLEGTMMKVDLAEPLAPGKTATLDMAW